MEDYKYLFKIVLIGNAGVGKTCLVRKFTQGIIPAGQGATIGVDFMIKSLVVNGVKVKLQIWDTAGQERFRSITQSYYRSAHCLILVYDASSQPTFDSLPSWCRDIELYAGAASNTGRRVLRVLVANKCDKGCDVPLSIAEQFRINNNFDLLVETSALEGENVEKLFHSIAEMLVSLNQEEYGNRINSSSQSNTSRQNSSCCS